MAGFSWIQDPGFNDVMTNLRSPRLNQENLAAHVWSNPRFPGRSDFGAAKTGSSIKSEMEVDSDLQCPICLELYSYPIILPCSHVLCRAPCAEQLFDFNFIRCPVCRDNCYVSGGIGSLPRVIALENIIHRFKQKQIFQKETENVTPSQCVKKSENSDIQQSEANERKHNRKQKSPKTGHSTEPKINTSPQNTPAHQVVTSQRNDTSKLGNSLCSQHSNNVLSLFCNDCSSLCCSSCEGIGGPHRDHTTVSMETAYLNIKATVDVNIQKLKNSQSSLVNSLKLQRDNLKDIQQEINRRRNEVNTQCDALLAEIENKRSFFLADLDYEERIIQTDIEDLIKAMETIQGSTDALQTYSNEVVKHDKIKFLQEANSLNEKLNKALLECDSVHFQPSDDDSIRNKVVDFRREKSVLRDLHYLSAPSTPVVDVTRCSRSENTVVLVVSPPNSIHDVIDQYEIHFCSEEQKSLEIEETLLVKNTPDDRLIARGVPNNAGGMVVIVIENLCKATTYYFCVSASNGAGKSANSEVVQCTTLLPGESVIPAPTIVESLCRQFTSSIQIYIASPQDVAVEQNISHFLMYRPVGQSRAWRTLSIYGRQDHRVFGLDSNMEYEFVVLACNPRGECHLSNKVALQTEPSAD